MKIYIQSKSGDLNVTTSANTAYLSEALKQLRAIGGYAAFEDGAHVFVPFEEIQYIREANEND